MQLNTSIPLKKKTAILGATITPTRYAYLAAKRLVAHGYPIVPLGIREGELFGHPIQNIRLKPDINEVDTVTLYINPDHQKDLEEYILGLNPRRIIFNPGTENARLKKKALKSGIEALEACTLVMLSSGLY